MAELTIPFVEYSSLVATLIRYLLIKGAAIAAAGDRRSSTSATKGAILSADSMYIGIRSLLLTEIVQFRTILILNK